jgi:alpha-L-fucosidase
MRVNRIINKGILVIVLLTLTLKIFSQSKINDNITQEWEILHQSKEHALKEFNDAKFGMFIHWGAYSLPAGIWKGEKIRRPGEWIFHNANIPRDEYKELCGKFNPIKFNAEEWIGIAKEAGMKYIVITAKHHDGFAMYNSDVTDYNIYDYTPFKRDPLQELYEACKNEGIRFGVYYSHSLDWMDGGDVGTADYFKAHPERERELSSKPVGQHPVYPFWTYKWPANIWDPSPVSYKEYLEKKAKPQMKELLQKFPGMIEIWYDFPEYMTREQSYDFYKLVYDIQSSCLVNSRVGANFGDFWIPGDNTIPENEETNDVYWETPGTMNSTWGYKSYDKDWKSTEELLFWLTEITSKGGNYLLNIGPTAQGVFPEESVERLKSIGKWMGVNGESVYGTKKWIVASEGVSGIKMTGLKREKEGFNKQFSPEEFWFSAKSNVVYATCLKWPDAGHILIKSFTQLPGKGINAIKSVQMLGCKEEIIWQMNSNGLFVDLPAYRPNPKGYVLKITLK